jgi:fimbrial isopeptide formation D2 family protein/LPXTG-motif cell wall-anchored protein
MKNTRKIVALILAIGMITVMGLSSIVAFAANGSGSGATITVIRHDSYSGTSGSEEANNRKFTWYHVFTATYTSNTSTGGGVSGSGAPGAVKGSGSAVSYTASAAVAAKLGTWNSGTGTWTHINDAEYGKWFVLTPTADPNVFSVTWNTDSSIATTAEEVQKAAKWLLDNQVYDGTGSLTFNSDGTWSATVEKGYYILQSDSGVNLIAATTDINITEKNTYPTIEKTQRDSSGAGYTTDGVHVAINDEIEYVVTVNVPYDADKLIQVYDAPSKGLQYLPNTMKVYADGTLIDTIVPESDTSSGGWKASFQAITYKGQKIEFKFKMKVTASAFTDVDRLNGARLEYGSGTTYKPNTPPVLYDIYYGGIYKYDGETDKPLSGTEFTITVEGEEYKVSPSGSFYIPDPSGSAVVLTNASGTIIIRGIDADKEYVFTETNPLPGYNPLSGSVTISSGTYMYLDESGSFKNSLISVEEFYYPVENNKGSLLPSTGGIGTTIFYVVGAVLVIGTGVILITRRRMGVEK